jgi:hypothetical protein
VRTAIDPHLTESRGWLEFGVMTSRAWCWMPFALGACASAPPPQPRADVAAMVASLDPGQSKTSVTGCLAEKRKPQSIVKGAGDGESDDVVVRVVAGGAVVTHRLTHTCCLEGDVSLTTRGNIATVHERLSGEPCVCNCRSTLETALGLRVGLWTIRVEVEQPFQSPEVVAERRVKILEPRAELPH